MNLPREDFCLLVLCAFRYALGRHTYVPSCIRQIVRSNIELMNTHDLELMVKEIHDVYQPHEDVPEHDFDMRGWLEFAKYLQRHLEESEK